MAEENASSPTISQGQTTSVAENAEATQEQPANPEGGEAQQPPSIFSNIWIYALVGIWIWWLLSSSKNRKKQKAEQEKLQQLQKGDKLITIGRMHGEVVAFTDDTITIKPDGKSDFTMTFDRQAIYKRLPRSGEEEPAK